MKAGREQLREWITKRFTSQREAAEFLGLHPVVLNQYLSGDRTPELTNAHLIEDHTGISTESWLLTELSTATPADMVDGRKRKSAGR